MPPIQILSDLRSDIKLQHDGYMEIERTIIEQNRYYEQFARYNPDETIKYLRFAKMIMEIALANIDLLIDYNNV